MLAWIGLALLSMSWLLGLGYYHVVDWRDWTWWALTVVAGTALLGTRYVRLPGWKASAAALAMIIPAIWEMPWPYRAAPVLLGVGLALALVAAAQPPLRQWTAAIAGTCLLAGCVLLSQSLAMAIYEAETSGSHTLPAPLPRIIGAAVGALGIDSSVHDATVAVFSMRKNHLFSATWELLLDPPTWCFLIGGIVMLCWKSRADLPEPGQSRPWLGPVLKFSALLVLWLPFRAALLISLYLEKVLRTDYEAPLDAMKVLWNPWVLLALLAGPVLLAWRFASPAAAIAPAAALPSRGVWRYPIGVLLAIGAAALISLGVFWDPVGERKGGRVLIEEYHPDKEKVWERTDKPYDTSWYGNMSGYNYYCIFDYCGRYYDVSRLTEPVDDAALQTCDVLILKVPTRPYAPEEIDAIVRFVERGGGLMMIGEHTDVFGTGTYLNAVARRFGFSYRFDCLFGIDSVFKEHYDRPLVPHPIIQDMPALDFAISCSIDPGSSSGRAVIRNTGLKSKMADYHVDNFYPQPDDTAEMEYGAFIQLWTTRFGKGRVAAFTDSTIFSNFCTFEPGKSELMVGMLEWLNHQGGPNNPRPWLMSAGAIFLLLALWLMRGGNSAWVLLVAACLLGWTIAVRETQAIHRRSMPPPPLQRPLVQMVIDRTLCDGPLSDAGFIDGKENGFGIFERWILRLGFFTSRRDITDPKYFQGDALVFLDPHLPLPAGFRDRLVNYVRSGGKVLVVVSPWEASDPFAAAGDLAPAAPAAVSKRDSQSTANALLEPFGLALDYSTPLSGKLDSGGKWPAVPIANSAVVTGGEPLAWIDDQPVAALCTLGAGAVTVVGFGNRFSDPNMGAIGDVIPDEALKAVYAVQFSMLGAMIENKPIGAAGRDGGAGPNR